MRISDIMMNNSFVYNISKTKDEINKLSKQISSSSRVLKPSDDPASAAKILKLGNQMNQNEMYSKNVANSIAFLAETTFSLESIQSEITDVLSKMTLLNNASNAANYQTFADQIDLSLKAILDAANTQTDGKYIFGGTSHTTAPYGLTADQLYMETKAPDVSGKQSVKTSSTIFQQINITGLETFGTILSGSGNLDSTAAIGSSYNTTDKIYNASKEEFDISITYTKTAANTYSLTYDITDGLGASIYSTAPAPVELKFNASTGKLETVDGKASTTFKISDSANHIDFNLDLNSLSESSSANSVSYSLNQKTDIFNTLIRIRDDLKNGVKPSAEDEEMVKTFNKHVLDKIALTGNITNQLTNTQELLTNQKNVLESLLANEQEIDVAKAVVDLENKDYLLQLAYKVSATILPKSLLDYL